MEMTIELWASPKFSLQVKLADREVGRDWGTLYPCSNHCSPLGPPTHPNMDSSGFKANLKLKVIKTARPLNGYWRTNRWYHNDWQCPRADRSSHLPKTSKDSEVSYEKPTWPSVLIPWWGRARWFIFDTDHERPTLHPSKLPPYEICTTTCPCTTALDLRTGKTKEKVAMSSN